MREERIGLFGGTFNPLHSGHLKAAEVVLKRFSLGKILFIPSYIPPHKDSVGVVSPSHRLNMVEVALRPFPRFVSSSIEIEAKGKSYSILTLNKMKKHYPESLIFFILGVDAFLEIETWKDHELVLEQCFFIVTDRPGYHLEEAKGILNGKLREKMYGIKKNEIVQEKMLDFYGIFLLSIPALDVSSTEIRKRIKNGDSIKGMVPFEVEAYIRKNYLYRL